MQQLLRILTFIHKEANMNMTVRDACGLLRCNTVQLAKKLGVTPPAVYQWKQGLPLARIYQVLDLAEGKKPIQTDKQKQAA